ncbi:MAG: PH domain-containing protein [Candidatus Saccharimonadales bacterium]
MKNNTTIGDHAHTTVFLSQPHLPARQPIPEVVRQKHDNSVKQFPELNLSEGEYVISAVRRHNIGLIAIWSLVICVILTAIIMMSAVSSGSLYGVALISQINAQSVLMVFFMIAILGIVSGVIGSMIYRQNRFYLTNESVTQHIQAALFSRKEQTISLANIEDASFSKRGFIQNLFNFGSLRLSTQGDETTYRFSFVADPGKEVAKLNDAIEAFKNGRPIDRSES